MSVGPSYVGFAPEAERGRGGRDRHRGGAGFGGSGRLTVPASDWRLGAGGVHLGCRKDVQVPLREGD